MEILFWLGFIMFINIVYQIGSIEANEDMHHDSRPGSFYEISQRKDK